MSADGALADESWEPCSMDAVVLAFLRAEWDKPFPGSLSLSMLGDRRIIDHADLSDSAQNNLRSSLLRRIRGGLLRLIPADTRWFAVHSLRTRHFHQVRAINHPDWRSPDDSNELLKVAVRKPEELRGAVSAWQSPILWGHDRDGPFTVLEGNHRMTALAGSPQLSECELPVYVGLSGELCLWHPPDGPALVEQGWPPSVVGFSR